MKADTQNINPALQSLFERPDQTVFLDANFFIPPDRSALGVKPYRFDHFREIWLDPLFSEFSGLSVHESVYLELVASSLKQYADDHTKAEPPRLKIHYDSGLSTEEQALLNYFIDRLALHSQYDPDRDNAKDRGEVRSLSYMAVKGYLYFAANDELPIRLIKEADRLDTGLDDMGIIQMYELIYYLATTGKYDTKALRLLYKYQYYLSARDKRVNPEWGIFMQQMDDLYSEQIRKPDTP
ncbi:MAG: hypothetical protein K5770_20845 [Lachnospiraceae bacterium]|nr:hypothetical protein [Lachnospiraceae bacterium]